MSFPTPAWAAAIRAKAALPQFDAARRALDEQAASYHHSLPALPDRQAGYYHDFFCPQHAIQLRFDPQSPDRHVCPVDGAVFSGEPFDSAWRWSVNDALSDAALKLAFRAFLDQDSADPARRAGAEGDRRRALEILLGYATRYRTMPPAPTPHPNHPGVVTWSGLDESVWIIRLAWAYGLSSDTPPDEAGARIRDDLLRLAADHLRRVRWPEVHNVTNWNNAALATLAIALDDEALLADALAGPLGLRAQLAGGVRGDGFWWEGSLSYHYYTLAALVWTARALRASAREFDGDEALRRMFHAPIEIALPDLSLPAIHDCWYAIELTGAVGHGIPDAAGFYETAYGWYGDPLFAWVLRRNYARKPREAFEALLDGSASILAAPAPALASCHAVESGLVVLRAPAPDGRRTWLLLKAGPDARDHGHPDQLSIQLCAGGARLTPDLGTPGYGIGLNETWYRQTASHSTALLDGRSQPPATGRIEHYRADGDFALAVGSVTWDDGPYAGVLMRRAIFWREDYFIDLFHVSCGESRAIDWVYHNLGTLIEYPDGDLIAGALTGDCGYQHLSDVRRLRRAGATRLRWQRGQALLDLHLPPADEEVFTGAAPGNPASEQLSVIVRRHTTCAATFVAIFAPRRAGEEPVVREVRWPHGSAPRELVVETARATERWLLDLEPSAARLTVSPHPPGTAG